MFCGCIFWLYLLIEYCLLFVVAFCVCVLRLCFVCCDLCITTSRQCCCCSVTVQVDILYIHTQHYSASSTFNTIQSSNVAAHPINEPQTPNALPQKATPPSDPSDLSEHSRLPRSALRAPAAPPKAPASMRRSDGRRPPRGWNAHDRGRSAAFVELEGDHGPLAAGPVGKKSGDGQDGSRSKASDIIQP